MKNTILYRFLGNDFFRRRNLFFLVSSSFVVYRHQSHLERIYSGFRSWLCRRLKWNTQDIWCRLVSKLLTLQCWCMCHAQFVALSSSNLSLSCRMRRKGGKLFFFCWVCDVTLQIGPWGEDSGAGDGGCGSHCGGRPHGRGRRSNGSNGGRRWTVGCSWPRHWDGR